MKEFRVQHKYCGMEKVIEGYDIWDALRKNGLNIRFWTEI